MDGSAYIDFMKIALICVLWYLCSTSDNIIGKVVLSDFPYPMTVTMVHLTTAAITLGPLKAGLKVPRGTPVERRYYLVMMVPLALGKFISSVSSYFSILKVSVSYAHTVKATLPLFTVVLSRVVLGERQTWPVYLALVPIITGVCIATATELSFDRLGLASSVFATFCFSLQTIFTKKCLKDTGYHHIELLTFITRLSTMLFLPVWLLGDFRRIVYDQNFLEGGQMMRLITLMLCAGLFNTLHNVLAFSVLAMVSPLSYAVANATKRIAIIGGSLIILQNPVGPMNVVGMLVAIFGVLSYNKAKYDQHAAARRQEVLPYVRSSSDLRHLAPHLGVPHLPHSKSDANFLANGALPSADQKRGGATDNGHILLQDWSGSVDGFTIVPLSSEDRQSTARQPHRPSAAPQSTARHPHRTNATPQSTANLHSRSVFHV